jgi:hypothetical protein
MADYLKAIQEINNIVENTPELNMGNYNELEVESLNNAMIEINNIIGLLTECESKEAEQSESNFAIPVVIVPLCPDCKSKSVIYSYPDGWECCNCDYTWA